MIAGLYLVATPIGNLGDFSTRAVQTLKDADAIACEDTRTSAALLSRYGIARPLISCHDHNEEVAASRIISRINAGESIALICDAGAPLVSDPGYRLVRAAREAGVFVTSIPGPVAFVTALQLSALPSDVFSFKGFMPNRSGARKRLLRDLADKGARDTVIFYESPNRLVDSLRDILEVLGDIRVCVARELTKKFEEVTTDTVSSVLSHYGNRDSVKGEIVLLLEVPESREILGDDEIMRRIEDRAQACGRKDAIAAIARETGLPRKKIYGLALRIKNPSLL